jgi:hypothetical protein
MNRAGLIERKEAVRAEIARLLQQLARAQQTHAAAPGQPLTRSARQIAELEARLEALMAEEHALRIQIDRSG